MLPFLARGCFCRGTLRVKVRVSLLLRSPGDRVLGTARSMQPNLTESTVLSCPH